MTHSELLLFGERIRNQRKISGLTQEKVADDIGVSLRFYQMIERGEKSVSLDTLLHLSKSLKISIDYLLFGDLPYASEHPLADIWETLSTHQREDAIKILKLYAKACQQNPSVDR